MTPREAATWSLVVPLAVVVGALGAAVLVGCWLGRRALAPFPPPPADEAEAGCL